MSALQRLQTSASGSILCLKLTQGWTAAPSQADAARSEPQVDRLACGYLVGITKFGSHVVSGGNAVQSASAKTMVKKIGH